MKYPAMLTEKEAGKLLGKVESAMLTLLSAQQNLEKIYFQGEGADVGRIFSAFHELAHFEWLEVTPATEQDKPAQGIERAADLPQEGNIFELLCWAEAGQQRANWLLHAYGKIAEYANLLQPELAPSLERDCTPAQAIAALEMVRDEAARAEGNEAVTALEYALTFLRALREAEHTESGWQGSPDEDPPSEEGDELKERG